MIATWGAEGMRLRASARQEWTRLQDADLREFQAAAIAAIHALEGDLKQAWDHELTTSENSKPWGSVSSPAAYAIPH
jgi:hypothetical protein